MLKEDTFKMDLIFLKSADTNSITFIFITCLLGYVSLFRVGGINGLDFDKVLDKQEGRILCLDWHSDGRHIVTGI